jgi:heme A synthase
VLTDSASGRAAARPGWLRFSRASIARGPRTLADAVLAPSPAAMRRIALAGVMASAGIILTGAAVRLSQSGLGCPDWPACTAHSIVAGGSTGSTLVHRWIEFGNRLVTGAILVIAAVVSWCSPSSIRSGSPCISCYRFRWLPSRWHCTSR